MSIEKIAEFDGLAVHYLEAGRGKTIVFLHGAGGAPPRGALFVPMLAERHRLLIPSRPGFDATPIGPCVTLQNVVSLMASFIRDIAHGKAHIVAQSLGGAVGLWLAALYPDLVESLVLSAPSAFAERRVPPRPEDMAQILYGDTPYWSAPPDAAEQQRIAANAQASMHRASAAEGNADLLERLSEIKTPTLLLWATGERLLPAEAMLPYQERMPHCHRILIHGAAHELPIAAAPRWIRLVGDFIDRGEMFVVNRGDETG